MTQWRQRALAAAGLVAAVLDERVVGPQLFEDVLLYRKGEFIGAIDRQEGVRTFLPFEVNAADQSGLDRLADLSLDESSDVARAARLYRKATEEGPTADGFALLWMAAECFSDHSSPSKKDIEAALDDAGLDPEGLPVSVGHMIGLRGQVQHHGLEDHENLPTAYYEMEAIVRCLIRQASGMRGGWWFASYNPAAFADPFKPIVAQMQGPGNTSWHQDQLPQVQEPELQRIPRVVARAQDDPRIRLDPRFLELAEVVATVVVEGIEWLDPDAHLEVVLERPEGTGEGIPCGANGDRIWLAPDTVAGVEVDSGEGLGLLVWNLFGLVGYALAQRGGLAREGEDGQALVEAIGSWLQYTRLVAHGELPAEDLNLPGGSDPISLGKLAGWAAAGDHRALQAIKQHSGEPARRAVGIYELLTENPPSPAIALLPEHQKSC